MVELMYLSLSLLSLYNYVCIILLFLYLLYCCYHWELEAYDKCMTVFHLPLYMPLAHL